MKRLRVGISVISNIFNTDGATIRTRRIAELLVNQCEVSIITRADQKKEIKDLEGINYIIVRPEGTKLWNFKLIPHIIKSKFDIVFCSNDWIGFITYYLLSKIYKYKIIIEAHSILSEEAKSRGYAGIKVKSIQIYEKFVARHTDYIIALSENTFQFYQKYNRNIELIPVFVDDTVFNINQEIESTKYQRQGHKLLGIIGPFNQLVNRLSLEFLYDNIERFDSRIHFLVIGKCDNRVENERIKYTGYIDSIEEYINTLSSLNAVLIPSQIATLGPLNKIIEPMSCSLPVFTTPKGMVGLYYLEPGRDIFVFQEDELADKLNELIFKDELMKETGQNARRIVEQYYSRKVNEERLIKLLTIIKGE